MQHVKPSVGSQLNHFKRPIASHSQVNYMQRCVGTTNVSMAFKSEHIHCQFTAFLMLQTVMFGLYIMVLFAH